VQQNAAGQSMGSGSPSLSAAGTAVSTNAASSQITEAASTTNTQDTLIREVRGASDVFSRQDIEYWVAGYNKERSKVSDYDRKNVRWSVKVGGGVIDVVDGRTGELIRGEKITLGIPDTWAGERILVMAYLKSHSENVSQETRVGPISQGTLIRMVEGPEETLSEQEVKYKVTRYNKDLHLVSADFRNSVKWAVKVGEKEPEVLNKTGEELILKIDKNWAGKTIVVMPHINKYTDIVSVRTEVKGHPISLYFDGKFLLLRIVRKTEILRFSYKAVSGRPDKDGKFNYSKERQAMKDKGPIPEGEYHINPQEIQYTDDRTTYDELKGVIGGGSFPGGRAAWGIGRVWIYPRQVVVNKIIRDNFSIHGGAEPGSAGCIDLTNNDKDFFDKLTQYRGNITKIPLTIKY
jgi:hypothetical protein